MLLKLNNLEKRTNPKDDNYQFFGEKHPGLKSIQSRLTAWGGPDQWTRMR